MGFFSELIKEAHEAVEYDYYVYNIYDKRDGNLVCYGVDDTMGGAERRAKDILSRFKHKKHYGIKITEVRR